MFVFREHYARKLLNPAPQLWILQHIVCPDLLWWDTMEI